MSATHPYAALTPEVILNAVEEQLCHEPAIETRNRKRLGENPLSDGELRIGHYRVFYDVVVEVESSLVKVKAVGYKNHSVLYVGGVEVRL